jgi:menaquinone-dependent protoporphyrinogen oxidase
MKIMIIYSTTEGHTRTIGEFLRDEALKAGHLPALFDSTVKPPSPEEYEAVIIAGSVHAGKYQAALQHYVHEHHETLNKMNTVFLSVSLTAASDETESWKELRQQTEDFLIATGWKPALIEYVAGALLYTKYDFLKRFLMRVISKRSGGDIDSSKDYIYTDWEQVKGVLEKVANPG